MRLVIIGSMPTSEKPKLLILSMKKGPPIRVAYMVYRLEASIPV